MGNDQNLVERVAREIAARSYGTGVDAEALARAVIKAMREPTEAMIAAAAFAGPDRYEPEGTSEVVWRAMIDAALTTS